MQFLQGNALQFFGRGMGWTNNRDFCACLDIHSADFDAPPKGRELEEDFPPLAALRGRRLTRLIIPPVRRHA